jgi:radical SAM protein with 4Fe4S-binding SPASM domain
LAILKENGISPFINSTISSETCESLPQLIRWVHDNGFMTRLDVVRQPDCFTPWSQDTKRDHSEVCDRLIKSFETTFEELKDPRYSYEFVSHLRICDLYFDNPACGVPCGIGHNHIVVKPDGKVVSCPMCVDEEGIEPGNDMLEACRRSFGWNPFERQKRPYDDECLACAWFSVCAGGCPILNLRMNNHPFSKSPFCRLYKFIIPGFISLLARKMMQGEGPKPAEFRCFPERREYVRAI